MTHIWLATQLQRWQRKAITGKTGKKIATLNRRKHSDNLFKFNKII